MKLLFSHREELAPRIWQYSFRPESPVRFVPGQYAAFTLPSVDGDPRGSSRTFTITSLPSDEFVSFVCRIDELRSVYKNMLDGLLVGDIATIADTMGDLILPKSTDVPLVFVAGGIGIASYVSMLSDMLARREERAVFLFYALRSRREQLYGELTKAYPLQLKQLVYAPNRLTAQEILDTTPPDAQLYLSGSQTFVEGLRQDLEVLGVERSSIVFDYYDGYAEL